MPDVGAKEIAERLKGKRRIAVMTHMRPDGDALGSALALSFALQKVGVETVVFDESPIPSHLAFLSGSEKIRTELSKDVEFDGVVCVDSAAPDRLGTLDNAFYLLQKKCDSFNVDHHISNTRYAKYNFVVGCSANCMNVFDLIGALGVEIDERIANLLMTGLITDSGGFAHDDVDERTFAVAKELVKRGAKMGELNNALFKNQPRARVDLYTETMSKIRYLLGGKLGLITIPMERTERLSADTTMTDGFVDFPLTVEGVEVSVSAMEVKREQWKISLRSKSVADVNKIAATYGGGGHIRAAGCMIFGAEEEVVDKISFTVSQYLED